MSDINEKKITFVSDTDVSMPVRWNAEAKDIRWNNAIAMAVVISRKLDKRNLWDGYLSFSLKTGTFKMAKPKMKLNEKYTDSLSASADVPLCMNFSETADWYGLIRQTFDTYLSDSMPYGVEEINAINDTTIRIAFSNPIFSSKITDNINAITVTATFGEAEYISNPISIDLDGVNGILLTVPSLEQVTDEVSVLYEAEKGNIMCSATGNRLNSFNAAFTYNINYSEGE